jgi:carbon-monoxide dehydrogenase small subunit
MTVSFLLNGKKRTVNVPANKRLVDVLKEDCGLFGGRAGCYAGSCGACAVLINRELILACLVPIFAAQDAVVVTIEGLEGTQVYGEILDGYRRSGAEPCHDCFQGKTLALYSLLTTNQLPRRDEVMEAVAWQQCGCLDTESICNAVDAIVNLRRFNRHGFR